MKLSRLQVCILGATVVTTALLSAGSDGQVPPSLAPGHVTAITQPSEIRKLSFPQMGLIAEKRVEEGDEVKVGQVLMRQDTDIDLKELERIRIEAQSNSRIEAAAADLKVRQLEYDRKKNAAAGAYTDSEIEEAEGKVIVGEKSLAVAREEQLQAKVKYEAQQVRIEKMHLKSPIDGVVQKIVVGVGESTDPQQQEGAIVVVKNDPLWVEIRDLTTAQVKQVKKGDKFKVRYEDEPNNWQMGEVIYITPLADAASDTQLVRLTLPNPGKRASGMHMIVDLPDTLKEPAVKTAGSGN